LIFDLKSRVRYEFNSQGLTPFSAPYQRKKQNTNFMVAHNALAHKLARAAYHIMKENVSFMPEKLFA